MNEGYVSYFPGTGEVDASKVFGVPGYHEQSQKISPLVVALFVGSLLSLFPLIGSVISLVTLPVSVILYQQRKARRDRLPGELLLRAAVGLSVLGFAIGLNVVILMLIVTATS
ncbi:MAG: hypothetical protein MSC45_03945 [Mobiluncus sp.]|uniref:hypothetical protein n=1 Tax=Mobiluncus sp. TaxID=47293 RepID=UPI00258BD3F6|nr:hypothetical protein [Mobiluncus sp.]MCI6584207.1 hypothetical protein [Mobiluncus sp.]